VSDSRAARIAADKAARRLAQSEFSQPVVVVAGAGTGKTALLVARVAAWCIGPGWELHALEGVRPEDVARQVIDGVVAITFTEAAAAEMAHKIAGGFLELAKGEGGKAPDGWDPDPDQLPEDRSEVVLRARALADEGHRLEVSTIHAFCQRLLATHPFEAGLHPHFEVDADGSRLEMLIEEVVEDALRDLADHHLRSAWERLAAEGKGPQQIGEALRVLVDAGADPAIFEPDPYDDDAAPIPRSGIASQRSAGR
jgi:ATP-dependent exoDNAse (exonuclease V) beta subunit